jgi:hypothetical protein
MKKRNWAFLKLYLKVCVRYMPGLAIAPFIGTYRYFMSVREKMDADFAAFFEEERKAQQEVSSSERAAG